MRLLEGIIIEPKFGIVEYEILIEDFLQIRWYLWRGGKLEHKILKNSKGKGLTCRKNGDANHKISRFLPLEGSERAVMMNRLL